MILGRGFDQSTGTVKGFCLSFTPYEYGPGGGLALNLVHKDLKLISNKYDLAQHLMVEAQGAYMFAGGSVNAKAKFTQDRKIHTYAVNFVALVEVETSWEYVSYPALTAGAAAMTPANFQTACGDSFISGILGGGEFYGVGQLSTRSDSQSKEMSAELGAKGVNWSASVKADASIHEAQSDSRLQIELWKRGSLGTQATTPDVDGLTAEANTFEQSVTSSGGVPIMVWVQSYKDVLGPNTPASGSLPGYLSIMQELLSLDAIYAALYEDALYVEAHKEEFKVVASTTSTMAALQQTAQSASNALKTAATQCLETSGATCAKPSDLPAPDQLRAQLPLRYEGVCGDPQFKSAVTRVNAYNLTRGDDDISGHNPSIDLTAELSKENNRYVFVNYDLQIKEDRSDWTTYKGERKWQLFDLNKNAPHCVFKTNWATPRSGKIDASGGFDNHGSSSYGGSGMIVSGKCLSDTDGGDNNDLYCKDLKHTANTMHLEHKENIITITPQILTLRLLELNTSFAEIRAQAQDRKAKKTKHVLDLAKAAKALGKGKSRPKVEPKNFKLPAP
jgi:hypothetical protein